MKTKPKIFIVGEVLLVNEFAALCRAKGVLVSVRYNRNEKANPPAGVKRIAGWPRSADYALELTNIDLEIKRRNLASLDKALARTSSIISSSITQCVADQAASLKHPERLAGISALPTLVQQPLVEISTSLRTSDRTKSAVKELASYLGKESVTVADRPGMVMPRILCAIINEACFAMMEGVAEARDIDTAMKLGTHYPDGPVAWGRSIGMHTVLAVMDAMYGYFHDDRYRAAPLLRELAGSDMHATM